MPYVRTDKSLDAITPSALPLAMYPHLQQVPTWRNDVYFRLSCLKVPDDRLTEGMKEIMMNIQVGDAIKDMPVIKRLVQQGIPLADCIKYVMDEAKEGRLSLNTKDRIEAEKDVVDAGYIVTGPLRMQRQQKNMHSKPTQRSRKNQHGGEVVYREVPLLDHNASHHGLPHPSSPPRSHEKVCGYIYGRGLVVITDLREVDVRLRQSPSVLCYIAAMLLLDRTSSTVDTNTKQSIEDEDAINHNDNLPPRCTTPPSSPAPTSTTVNAESDGGMLFLKEQTTPVGEVNFEIDSSSSDDDDTTSDEEEHDEEQQGPSCIFDTILNLSTLGKSSGAVADDDGLQPVAAATAEESEVAPKPHSIPRGRKTNNNVERLHLPPFGASIATAARQARIRAHRIQSTLGGGSSHTANHVHPLLQQGSNHVAEVEDDATDEDAGGLYHLVAPMAVWVVQSQKPEGAAFRAAAIDNNRKLLHTGLSQTIDWLRQEPSTHTPGSWGATAASFVEPYLARPAYVFDVVREPVIGREGYAIAAFPHATQHGEFVWLVRLLSQGESFDCVESTMGKNGGGSVRSEYCVCPTNEVYRRKVMPPLPRNLSQHAIPHEVLRDAMLLITKPQEGEDAQTPKKGGTVVPYFSNPSPSPTAGGGTKRALPIERELAAECPSNGPTDDAAIILQGCWVPQCYPSRETCRDEHHDPSPTTVPLSNPHSTITTTNSQNNEGFFREDVDPTAEQEAERNECGDEIDGDYQHYNQSEVGEGAQTPVVGEEAPQYGKRERHEDPTMELDPPRRTTNVDVRLAAMMKDDKRSEESSYDDNNFTTMHRLLGALTVGDEPSLKDRIHNRCKERLKRLDAITRPKDTDPRLGFYGADFKMKRMDISDNLDMLIKEVQMPNYTKKPYDPLDCMRSVGCEFRMTKGAKKKEEPTAAQKEKQEEEPTVWDLEDSAACAGPVTHPR